MKNKSNRFKDVLLLIVFGELLYWGLNNYKFLGETLGGLWSLLLPFIVGLCIAFILNVPMKALERLIFKERPNTTERAKRIIEKIKRPASLILTLVIFIGAIFLVCFIVIPEISNTFKTLKDAIPGFTDRISKLYGTITEKLPEINSWVENFNIDWQNISKEIATYAQDISSNLINSTVDFASSFFTGVYNGILGIIFAVYILLQKEKLERQMRSIISAYIPDKHAEYFIHVCRMINNTFSKFLGGQCTEAFILGSLCFIGMTILRIPYALAVGVLVTFTAFIPIVGAFLGTAIGAFLICVTDPIKALWFIVFFIILQQVEGNLIYPRVVGSSVGLPSLWVLFAVTVGGGMMGILGIFVSVPICSVIYCLLKENVDKRLLKKNTTNTEETEEIEQETAEQSQDNIDENEVESENTDENSGSE